MNSLRLNRIKIVPKLTCVHAVAAENPWRESYGANKKYWRRSRLTRRTKGVEKKDLKHAPLKDSSELEN